MPATAIASPARTRQSPPTDQEPTGLRVNVRCVAASNSPADDRPRQKLPGRSRFSATSCIAAKIRIVIHPPHVLRLHLDARLEPLLRAGAAARPKAFSGCPHRSSAGRAGSQLSHTAVPRQRFLPASGWDCAELRLSSPPPCPRLPVAGRLAQPPTWCRLLLLVRSADALQNKLGRRGIWSALS